MTTPSRRRLLAGAFAFAFASFASFAGATHAAEVAVSSSGGFAAAYKLLKPQYEQATGNTLTIAWGPSMGETPNTIPSRLKRGEPIDVVIMVDSALDGLIREGRVSAASKVVLAKSIIGLAVKAGAPRPDISNVEALKKTLLNARSIAYSDSASGVYLEKTLFPRLGIWEQIKGKSRGIPAEPVAAVVARGEAEIGFQQIAELKPVAGIDIVGPLPDGAQQVTLYSAGVVTASKQPEAARAFIDFLRSDAASASITQTGLEPTATAK